MGIIRRQSIQSSILFYIGAALGFLSKILIFPNFLTAEEVGLSNILVTNAMLFAQIAAIGFSTTTLRFFPYFQDKARRHHDFLPVLLLIPAVGFVIVSLLVLVFREPLLGYFQEKSPLMVDYFWYLFPLSFATLYFELFDAYLRSLQKAVVPILFREIVQRVLVVICILIYAVGWVDFPQFVFLYVGMLCSVTLMMVVYLYWLGHFRLRFRQSWRMKKLLRRILVYGGFTLLGNISAMTIYTIDGLMLAAYVGMDAVGIYTTCFYVTALMMIPWRAMQKVAAPQVAEFWRSNDMKGMDRLYKRTSLINMGVGCYLFAVMIIGMDTLFEWMPLEYRAGRSVLLIVGATRLIDMVTGLNGYIMLTSKYYRMDLYANISLVVTTIGLNMWLIPLYGIMGAALATSITLGVINGFRLVFLWWKLGMHPFSKEMGTLALLSVVAFLAQWILPTLDNVILSFGLRFVVFSLLFIVPMLYWQLLPDANRLYEMVLNRVNRGGSRPPKAS